MAHNPHPEMIRAELRIRYGSINQFERTKGLPLHSCKDVLTGKSRPAIAQAISDELAIPLHDLFPLRWVKSPNSDDSIPIRFSHRLKAEAA